MIFPDGARVGPHLFFVQLRSVGVCAFSADFFCDLTLSFFVCLDDHSALPGIDMGDIGAIILIRKNT